jgi:hypothetical protein
MRQPPEDAGPTCSTSSLSPALASSLSRSFCVYMSMVRDSTSSLSRRRRWYACSGVSPLQLAYEFAAADQGGSSGS